MKNIGIRQIVLVFVLGLLGAAGFGSKAAAQQPEKIVIDAGAKATPFPHYWEQAFGSGRANLALRESYRNDLRDVKKIADFKYVRFHAIFHDENGVYDEDEQGNPQFNFTYVGQIYDGLLKNGVKPLVEISFMPKKLALRQDLHPFWYKQNVSPPKDYAKWDLLIKKFAEFLVDRYGIEEVAQWYFEVWNEPNIDFWSGEPKQATYFELYDHTARALKAVNARLRVGGPSSSSAHWVSEFVAHAAAEKIPVDFVSTHGYADDTTEDYFGKKLDIPIEKRMCKAVEKVHKEILTSPMPKLPLFWTEWNVSGYGERHAGDTSYSATAIAQTVRDCDGLMDMASFWTFSDVFEENGPFREPFPGGFGLEAPGGIRKPHYYTFSLLHKLGDTRIANDTENILVTRRADGKLVVAVWNLWPPDQKGEEKEAELEFRGAKPNARVSISRIDSTHGNTLAAWAKLGSPRYPTEKQVEQMNQDSALPTPEQLKLTNGKLKLHLPVNGFVLVETEK